MSRSAKVTSVEALQAFRGSLQKYQADVRDALVQLTIEVRRGLDWIENDRSQYWRRQYRKASDRLQEARSALARCEMTMGGGDSRSCYDEKQALEKARRRLRLVEDKIKTVHRWTQAARHEIEQFDGQMSTLGNYMDNDIPRAIAALQRMHASLIKYVSSAEPGPRHTMQSDNPSSSVTTSSGATPSDNVAPELPAPDAKRQPPLAGDDSIEERS